MVRATSQSSPACLWLAEAGGRVPVHPSPGAAFAKCFWLLLCAHNQAVAYMGVAGDKSLPLQSRVSVCGSVEQMLFLLPCYPVHPARVPRALLATSQFVPHITDAQVWLNLGTWELSGGSVTCHLFIFPGIFPLAG